MKVLFRVSLVAFVVVGILALMVGFVNWRGKQAWEVCKAELEAKGEHLDVAYYIPPQMPDDQNFAMTRLMKPLLDYTLDPNTRKAIFREPNPPVKRISTEVEGSSEKVPVEKPARWILGLSTDLQAWQAYYRMALPGMKLSKTPAEDVLAALGRFDGTLDELREAARTHPQCRYPVKYEQGADAAMPHLMVIEHIVQVLALRACAELELNRVDEAYADEELCFTMINSVRDDPALLASLGRILALRVLIQPLWEGIAHHQWTDAQLVQFKVQLRSSDWLADFQMCMRMERGFENMQCDRMRFAEDWLKCLGPDSRDSELIVKMRMWPFQYTWTYQNQIFLNRYFQDYIIPAVDVKTHRIFPSVVKKGEDEMDSLKDSISPAVLIARIALPVFQAVSINFGRIQTSVDEASIACEIERWRLAHGSLPRSLEELGVSDLPHDVINGGPLHYRVTEPDDYLLYSVGWNGTDDGGTLVRYGKSSTSIKFQQGDWVWSLKPL